MPVSRRLTIIFAVLSLGSLLGLVFILSRPRGPVLMDVSFSLETITPNADGVTDATQISYRLRREAVVSITFEDEAGRVYNFREGRSRVRGEYSVLFSGVVDGYTLPDETVYGEVITRLLKDGTYTYRIEAVDTLTEQVDTASGKLTISGADETLPDFWEFSVSPDIFTPNQDGLSDIVWINAFIPKEADLDVYLIGEDGIPYFVPEEQKATASGDAGRHSFRWDGGVDLGRNPPPDGDYVVVAVAQDEEGQRLETNSRVEVSFGGVPFAEIIGQPTGHTVEFSAETILVGDVLTFTLTVENYGDAPIRTSGPEPGYIYEQVDLYASTGFYEESGAWRVGIHCQTCETDYPWRWSLGTAETLTPIPDKDGRIHYYLMPGERAVITGGIRLTNIVESRNPQQFWAGLIHEDVGIAEVNQRVDAQWIEIIAID